jgi:hypothetical protein
MRTHIWGQIYSIHSSIAHIYRQQSEDTYLVCQHIYEDKYIVCEHTPTRWGHIYSTRTYTQFVCVCVCVCVCARARARVNFRTHWVFVCVCRNARTHWVCCKEDVSKYLMDWRICVLIVSYCIDAWLYLCSCFFQPQGGLRECKTVSFFTHIYYCILILYYCTLILYYFV